MLCSHVHYIQLTETPCGFSVQRLSSNTIKHLLVNRNVFVRKTATSAVPTCGEREGGWTVVARFSSLFVGVGWQETLLELWDWLGSPATVRVMGLVTGRFPPGPTYRK